MKKVNFKTLQVFTNFAKSKSFVLDTRESFADTIYQNFPRIGFHALAIKIYNSDGEIEIDEREEACLKQVLDSGLITMQFTDAVELQLK